MKCGLAAGLRRIEPDVAGKQFFDYLQPAFFGRGQERRKLSGTTCVVRARPRQGPSLNPTQVLWAFL